MVFESHISNDILERIRVSPDKLLLDNKNPRFYGENIDKEFIEAHPIDDPKLQEFLRQSIYSRYNVQEIVTSISEVGFLRLDPIIVEQTNEFYRVVEGNRRITAIKTILGNIKRRLVDVSENVKKSLEEIEVVNLVKNYDESTIWMLQGLRHVSGTRNWGPFQQAELIKTLYDKRGLTFKQIGSAIGLSPQRVSTILKAYYGIIQMKENETWSELATPDLFSHFEQAHVKPQVRDWLGWDKEKNHYTNEKEINLFYKWITQEDQSIPREKLCSRDIRDKLPIVLDHEEAKKLLIEESVNINEAYSIALTGKKFSQEFISTSKKFLNTLDKLEGALELSTEEKEQLSQIDNKIKKLIKK